MCGAIEVGSDWGAKTIVLTHLTDQIDQPALREQIVHEVQQIYSGTVISGEDLMRLGLTGKPVGGIETRQG